MTPGEGLNVASSSVKCLGKQQDACPNPFLLQVLSLPTWPPSFQVLPLCGLTLAAQFKKEKCCFPGAALPLPQRGWIARHPPPFALIWETPLEGRRWNWACVWLLGKQFSSILGSHCGLSTPLCLTHTHCGPAKCRQWNMSAMAPCQLRKCCFIFSQRGAAVAGFFLVLDYPEGKCWGLRSRKSTLLIKALRWELF